ncbi:SGNH/GDSL hydrolase family protein [Paenibacillus faecis]|uniref:SGNH/GDSL hydrolase family protein n=1 Tax=Paenibacillus faecis TaxID=862114 RepID=A0A5D0D416_9BACL|nr:SGNH/GDSL hydrolase family protein [Paenibacillus faecis]TYA15325.1 SGNH/GDSL hydrolase family protein [Paenibacillus faecis]
MNFRFEGTEDPIRIPDRKRIVFLGDSITENGAYIRYLDAFFLKHFPNHRLDFINLGVGSETAAGTHESSHPFPRPCVHERLERALAESRPDWVFFCYGMNDGIYHPFSEERFRLYREGMLRAVEQAERAGARVILMTPPPFDVLSVNGEPLPEGMPDYAFETPYEGYNDEVLGKYADWLERIGAERGCTVVDLREPLLSYIRQRREADPAYKYGDAVHPEEDGHWVMARAILKDAFHIVLERTPAWVEHLDGNFISLVRRRRDVLNAAWREHVGHSNPFKFDALPLEEAERVAEAMLEEIRAAAEQEE